MSCCEDLSVHREALPEACLGVRASFSAYLDGALDGRTMGELAQHFDACPACAAEFAAWRSLQSVLGELGPATLPSNLQAQLRDVLATEIGTGRHLSPIRRILAFSRATLAPVGLRFAAGLALTVAMLGSAAGFLGSALPVQANDDRLAHSTPPHFLYTQQPTLPVMATDGTPAVVVLAKVDAKGRVYDFDLLDGPSDSDTRDRVQAYLLASVFHPAMVFGEPVPGHAVLTFTTVSARA